MFVHFVLLVIANKEKAVICLTSVGQNQSAKQKVICASSSGQSKKEKKKYYLLLSSSGHSKRAKKKLFGYILWVKPQKVKENNK